MKVQRMHGRLAKAMQVVRAEVVPDDGSDYTALTAQTEVTRLKQQIAIPSTSWSEPSLASCFIGIVGDRERRPCLRDSQAKGDALVPHRASQDGFQTGNWSRHQLRDASTARSLANSDLISELAVAAALNAYKPEADIFCLRRGGDGSNPLNYRPLALLYPGYKILTWLLATEARKSIASRITSLHNGFGPGCQIHATIDYAAAAQRMAQCLQKYEIWSYY
ncbi:hypothetical protein GQ600_6922 [Phytophthora cactorum]|nr:hypothetical protein GQ600_6922 [Phytophthora cactorum]